MFNKASSMLEYTGAKWAEIEQKTWVGIGQNLYYNQSRVSENT